MNRIEGIVEAIEPSGIVTYIRIRSGEETLNVIKSQTPEWIGVGDRVGCTFQEASVCVSTDCPVRVSIENRLCGTLSGIRRGQSLCELTFECALGKVVSLITEHACEDLELEPGCEATMLLRGVDVGLEPLSDPIELDAYKKMASRMKDAY